MNSKLVKITILAGLLVTFGGIKFAINFFTEKTPEERIEVIVNNQELSASQKIHLLLADRLLLDQSGDLTGSLQFHKLGQACFAKSRRLRETDPKKADYLERAAISFRLAADGLKKSSSKEQVLMVRVELEKAFQMLEEADEPVKLPMRQ
jgi:hypothetical protein